MGLRQTGQTISLRPMQVHIHGRISPKRGRITFTSSTHWRRHAHFESTLSRESRVTALDASVDFDPYTASVDRLVDAWLPLTFAFNSINRSMGLGDLYPFVLNASSMRKLDYIYNKIHHRAPSESQSDHTTLKAIVASLKRDVASP